MNEPKECKICGEKSFKFHESVILYDPDDDLEKEFKEVYECLECKTHYYEVNNCQAMILERIPGGKTYELRIAEIMKK